MLADRDFSDCKSKHRAALTPSSESQETKQQGYRAETYSVLRIFNFCLRIAPPQTPLAVWKLGWSCNALLPAHRGVFCGDRFLTLASTVWEIRGWILRGCWCRLWFEEPYYVHQAFLPSSSGKQSPLLPISPCVIEYLSCIWFEGERFLGCGSSPPRLETQHPVIGALKCGCHFLPLGHG